MKTMVISALMMFLAYFLVLYGGVGFIQDKRFFSSAPKENLQAIPDKKERFPGAHILGWAIEGVAVLLFLAVLYAVELYDIVFFDWVLLCHSGFFPHFYPELKGVVGPHMFGYNKRTHILHCLLDIPAAAAAAGLCTLL